MIAAKQLCEAELINEMQRRLDIDSGFFHRNREELEDMAWSISLYMESKEEKSNGK